NLRLDVDDADGTHHAGAWPRMTGRDVAALERGLRRGQERVAAYRNRCRPGMGRLAGEAEHVALDAECAEHDAGRLVHRFEHRPLLDVELEVGAGGSLRQLAMRVEHAIECDAVLRERVDEPRPLPVLQLPDVV